MTTAPTRRAVTATIVTVGPPGRTREALAVMQAVARHVSVRSVLITLGDDAEPQIRTEADVVTIEGLASRYLNNAVASLRLSSLPSLAWWRGGDRHELEGLAELVDRIALDSVDPREDWEVAGAIADTTAVSDLRWTRLTRWRNLMAQFFDIPDTRAACAALSTLDIAAGDPHAARLFGGWMAACLPNGNRLNIRTTDVPGGATIESVTLGCNGSRLSLRLLPNRSCIESSLERDGSVVASRVAPAGDERLEALLAEELRVRSRDLAFEGALRIARTR
ncbi:MAG: glucose-6-phosphate dehydrogenase assembly protein OpcA [Acidobacteria bacterium]|nr:glucose-6-phosphate dehydrogenase assembly protein OpcA [Acidobacteriota bacterium]